MTAIDKRGTNYKVLIGGAVRFTSSQCALRDERDVEVAIAHASLRPSVAKLRGDS